MITIAREQRVTTLEITDGHIRNKCQDTYICYPWQIMHQYTVILCQINQNPFKKDQVSVLNTKTLLEGCHEKIIKQG